MKYAFEVFDDHLRDVLPMAVQRDEFELACFVNEFLYAVGALIVKDVLFRDNSCFFDAFEVIKIVSLHFDILAA